MTKRNILFITTDQQRYDALGCNGGTIARTPVVDGWAADGIVYRRAYNQNTVCMPARSTMLTGQYVRTHGVVANGVPLPEDAPSIAAHLASHGYHTALWGKAHFEPGIDLQGRYRETRRADEHDTGPWRGFDQAAQVMHTPAALGRPIAHYGYWLTEQHPEFVEGFANLLQGEGGGDTGAPETKNNPIPREYYHTDWVADLVLAWLDQVEDPWFCWMSFPDPHHPWDPPAGECPRINWRDLDLPPGHPGSPDKVRAVLEQKPAHWLGYWEGTFRNREGGPAKFAPSSLTDDQIREINAKTHVMNELIDEACGRVWRRIVDKGWADRTDVFFTTDHGELQGDFGLLYKGPYHTDALMRLPLVWRPAPVANVTPSTVTQPVGQLDLAPTFCEIAGVPVPDWAQGRALPVTDDGSRERVLCEWDSQFPGYGMHLRSIYRDGWLCTVYEPSTVGQPNGLEKRWGDAVLRSCRVEYDGSEGELYHVEQDPHQWTNRWDDPSLQDLKSDLVADLYDSLPKEVKHLEVEAPA